MSVFTSPFTSPFASLLGATAASLARGVTARATALGLVVSAAVGVGAPAQVHAAPSPVRATTASAALVTPARPVLAERRAPRCHHQRYMRVKGRKVLVSALCGRKLSDREMVRVLRRAGWTWREMPDAVATFKGESDGWTLAVHYNRSRSGRLLSTDLSWTQVNDRWNPGIRRVDYANPLAAARYALRVKRSGGANGMGQWNAYGSRHRYMRAARVAIAWVRHHG